MRWNRVHQQGENVWWWDCEWFSWDKIWCLSNHSSFLFIPGEYEKMASGNEHCARESRWHLSICNLAYLNNVVKYERWKVKNGRIWRETQSRITWVSLTAVYSFTSFPVDFRSVSSLGLKQRLRSGTDGQVCNLKTFSFFVCHCRIISE